MKVIKFGGSSLASATQLKKVYKIVVDDPKRKFVVVSAPGKRFAEDVKVTDLLIDCGAKHLLGETATELEQAVLTRYASIADELGLGHEVMERIERDFKELISSDKTNPDRYMDRIKASGEDNNAKLIAAFFSQSRNGSALCKPARCWAICNR